MTDTLAPGRAFAHRLCSETLAEVHGVIANVLARGPARGGALLDVGCWDGVQTTAFAAACAARPYGVEYFPGPAAAARARGVDVSELDLEADPLPYADQTFDVVVVNQVLEHLKNVWLPLAEMYRVLRVGGILIASVPNLASLHNRLLLAAGVQPTSIRVRGPHVRGYTHREFVRLLEYGGVLGVEESVGVGFHPLPPRAARRLARLWVGASHTPVCVARKRAHVAPDPWTAYRAEEDASGVQTAYSARE